MDRVSSMLSFVKVVELGGFAAAARQLNLANSVVTSHVKSLEERLGARLLNRTTRSVSLTEAGRGYYERCVQIFRKSKTLKRLCTRSSQSRGEYCGSIRRPGYRQSLRLPLPNTAHFTRK